jgi:hypothetical protein
VTKPATPTKTKTKTATGLTREGKGRIDDYYDFTNEDERTAGKANGQTSFSDETNDEDHKFDKWLAEESARLGDNRNAFIESYAQQISNALHTSVAEILLAGKFCARARTVFTQAERGLLLSRLGFREPAFRSKMVRIGNDVRLKAIRKLLPPNYSIIYEIALLDDEQLELAKRKHLIRPDVTREKIKEFRKSGADAAADGEDPDSIDDEFDEPEVDEQSSRPAAMQSKGAAGGRLVRGQDADGENAGGGSSLDAAYSELKREWVEASADARVHFVTKVLRVG